MYTMYKVQCQRKMCMYVSSELYITIKAIIKFSKTSKKISEISTSEIMGENRTVTQITNDYFKLI